MPTPWLISRQTVRPFWSRPSCHDTSINPSNKNARNWSSQPRRAQRIRLPCLADPEFVPICPLFWGLPMFKHHSLWFIEKLKFLKWLKLRRIHKEDTMWVKTDQFQSMDNPISWLKRIKTPFGNSFINLAKCWSVLAISIPSASPTAPNWNWNIKW